MEAVMSIDMLQRRPTLTWRTLLCDWDISIQGIQTLLIQANP